MELSFEDIGDLRVIKAQEDRIDAAIAIQFKDRMRELTETAPARLLLDLSRVDFLDSSGLGAVVAAFKQAAPERRLELAQARDVGQTRGRRLGPLWQQVLHLGCR